MNKKKFSPLIVFLSSLLWAGDAPFRVPLLLGGLSVPFIAFLEHVFNALASLPALWRKKAFFLHLNVKQILGLIYIGAGASALAALLYVQGAVVMHYNFTIAALLQKLQPIFAIILAVIFLKEKLNRKFWALVVPALFGAYLVTFGWTSPQSLWQTAGHLSLFGPLLAILAAALWAGGTVVGRALLADLDFQFVNGMRFVFGFLFLLIYVSLSKGTQFSLMTGLFWRNVLIIAMLTGFLALLLYYYGLRHTKASVATLMELGYPLAITLVNWKFLGITLNSAQVLGAATLVISVTFIVLSTHRETTISDPASLTS